MFDQEELNTAVKIWLDYKDKDRFDEEEAKKVTGARITIREALRSGCILLNPNEFDSDSETECYNAIQKAKGARY